MYDPIIQKYMSHFFDVHGNLHITIKSDLTRSLGWATPKYDNNGEPIASLETGGPVHNENICLDIDYSEDIGNLNDNCNLIIKKKSKALSENNDNR